MLLLVRSGLLVFAKDVVMAEGGLRGQLETVAEATNFGTLVYYIGNVTGQCVRF